MSDILSSLPLDDEPVTTEDQVIIDAIAGTNTKYSLHLLLKDSKITLLSGIVFAIISSPQIVSIIKDLIPYTKTSISSLIGIQSLLFMLCIFIFSNIKYINK